MSSGGDSKRLIPLTINPHSKPLEAIVDVDAAQDIARQVLSRCRGLSCLKAVNTLIYAALIVAAESGLSIIESFEAVARRVRPPLEPRVHRLADKEGALRGGSLQVREEGSRGLGEPGAEESVDTKGG